MNFRFDYVPDGKTPKSGIDFNLSDAELKMPIDDLLATVFKPALSILFAHINKEPSNPVSGFEYERGWKAWRKTQNG